MSILIKGMEIPIDGFITVTITSDGRVVGNSKRESDKFEYLDNKDIATAVPVPPHGRLGDLDAFESVKYELPNGQKAFNRGFHSGVQYVQRLIMDAPTIIPESKEGE